jgi:hypothetical protein
MVSAALLFQVLPGGWPVSSSVVWNGMPRHFRLEDAESLLPEVERALRDAIFQKTEYEAADGELDRTMQRIRMAGGSRVSPGPILSLRARKDSAAVALAAVMERINNWGVQVKDLDIGLIDFPTLYRGREVLLCWKLGEERIGYWHGVEEGYRGRKAIDDEFRAEHRGAAPN